MSARTFESVNTIPASVIPMLNAVCTYCARAAWCDMKSDFLTVCVRPKITAHDVERSSFKMDAEKYAEAKAARSRAMAAFKASFKRVKPWQIRIGRKNGLVFEYLPLLERKEKSHGGEVIWLDEERLTAQKWCEQCGATFETVNKDRRLCDGCSAEIVSRLRVTYNPKDWLCKGDGDGDGDEFQD